MNYIMLILNLLLVLSYHVRRKSYTLLSFVKFNNIGAIRINAPHPFTIVDNEKSICDLYELQHADSESVIGFAVSRQSKKF